jgi:predicted dithiol-disulfide oxidoreductase (DUF899 family)
MSKQVTSKKTIDNPRVVSREEWITARRELLAKEKNLTRQRDSVSSERRQLPWVTVDKEYIFDAPGETPADLFEGRSQLIVYHFMFGPEWKEGCPSCSFNMNHTEMNGGSGPCWRLGVWGAACCAPSKNPHLRRLPTPKAG